MISQLFNYKKNATLHGGLRFTKAASPSIETLPTPDALNISLEQHRGAPAKLIVKKGDSVTKGQPLTFSEDLNQVPVHASEAGIISSINQNCISITTQTQTDQRQAEPKQTGVTISREQLIKTLHQCGIVGMGGAGFPAAKKIAALTNKDNLLLVNAAECDPIIHCDDALMQNHANEIVLGIALITSACDIGTIVIGVEDNKPESQRAIRAALTQQNVKAKITTMPSVYPSGAETILAQLCIDHNRLNNSFPPARRLSEKGILSFNVATCFAIYQAVIHGTPLISRITSIVDVQGNIRNFRVPIGTPIAHILKHTKSNHTLQHQVTTGGHMMGTQINLDDAIIKTSNCIAVRLPDSTAPAARACIRCGACADVCPEHLLPQQLHMHATHFNELSLHQYEISNCIECGCCDVVCPSHIPLTESFQTAKQQLIENQDAKNLADIAKIRFEKRQYRLANKTELRTRKAAIKKPTMPDTPLTIISSDQGQKKKQLIEAALKRKEAKRKSTLQNSDNNK